MQELQKKTKIMEPNFLGTSSFYKDLSKFCKEKEVIQSDESPPYKSSYGWIACKDSSSNEEYLYKQISTLTTENINESICNEKILSPIPYQNFYKRMVLQGHFRRNFLNHFPPEIKGYFFLLAQESFYDKMIQLQMTILQNKHCYIIPIQKFGSLTRNSDRNLQYLPDPYNLFLKSIVFYDAHWHDHISELMHHGFLRILWIKNLPLNLFGDQISFWIQIAISYFIYDQNFHHIKLIFFSDLPIYKKDGSYLPARHHIILLPCKSKNPNIGEWDQTYTSKITLTNLEVKNFLRAKPKFDEYFNEIQHELICQTSIIGLWMRRNNVYTLKTFRYKHMIPVPEHFGI